MMTFEEFFIKKKIDIAAFKLAELDLYEEFRIHYDQMGEKSFDHTKKYWFNKLRKHYHLAESAVKAEPKIIKSNVEVVTSTENTTAKPVGFKPKFKAGLTKPIENPIPEEKTSTAEEPAAIKPAGFKPRFKAGITNPVENPVPEEKTSEAEEPAAPKPAGFKPRFKAGITKPVENPIPEEKPSAAEEPAAIKPAGFKPRFKAGITKINKDQSDQ